MSRVRTGVLLVAVMTVGVGLVSCASDTRGAESEDLIDAEFAPDGPGCAAAAAVAGEVVWSYERGLADMDRWTAIDAETRFNIGSISKQFTALSAVSLAEEGRLDLEAPVSDYLDGLPDWADEATVRDLMGHTAGILDPTYSLTEVVTRDTLIAKLVKDPTTKTEIGRFLYSNTGYMLLGLIVEEVVGDDLGAWLHAHVFDAAKVDMITETDAGADMTSIGYQSVSWPHREMADRATIPGPTGVLASASELARWGDQYRVPTVVSAEALADAIENGTELPLATYGPGIFVTSSGVIEHTGEDDGFRSFFVTDPARATTLAITCNHLLDGTLPDRLAELWVPTLFSPAPTP